MKYLFNFIVFSSIFLLLSSCSIPQIPNKIALVYGISEYGTNQDAPNLNVADDDANALADLFTLQEFNVIKRVNSEATKATILNDIASLQGSSNLVVFYYSGHGTIFNNRSAICPKDIWSDISNSIQPDNFISDEELFSAFNKAGLKHVVVLLDCCFSGGFVNSGATIDAIPPIFGPNEIPSGTINYTWLTDAVQPAFHAYFNYVSYGSAIVISAGGSGEPVWETQEHGIFTNYLLRTATFGDLDRDGFVSTTEIYRYISTKIQTDWNNYYQNYFDTNTDQYADFHPHLTGSPREYLIFKN